MLAGEPDPTQYDDLRTLKQAMNSDLPQGGAGLPLQHWSDERLRATFRLVQGERLWLALARDHEGRTAGYTELRNRDDADNRELLLQGDTIVLSGHRGHGLGRSLKAAAMAQGRRADHLPRALACAATALTLVQRVQADPLQAGATQIARLSPDPAFPVPTALAQGITGEITAYAEFEGFRVVTLPSYRSSENASRCMTVWQPALLSTDEGGGFSYDGDSFLMGTTLLPAPLVP